MSGTAVVCSVIGKSWFNPETSLLVKFVDPSLLKEWKTGVPQQIVSFFTPSDKSSSFEDLNIDIDGYSVRLFKKDESRVAMDLSEVMPLRKVNLTVDKHVLLFHKESTHKISVSIDTVSNYVAKHVLPGLDSIHREKLLWAERNEGEVLPWSELNQDSFRICMTAKGIYKPAKSEFSLSVKETLNSPYVDGVSAIDSAGNWTYLYHQEGQENTSDDNLATNIGLDQCRKKNIPVIVCIQQTAKPDKATYKVFGVGRVIQKKDGFYTIKSVDIRPTKVTSLDINNTKLGEGEAPYNPSIDEELRETITRSIKARRGQDKFRGKLLSAYQGSCAMSGTSLEEVLEAAHIVPYRGEYSNHVTNGMLLRADIHTLWDEGLICIDEASYRVILSSRLNGSIYEAFSGNKILLPIDKSIWPSTESIKFHRKNIFKKDYF